MNFVKSVIKSLKVFDWGVHFSKHARKWPFVCISCRNTFCAERGLVNHRKTHVGDQPNTSIILF